MLEYQSDAFLDMVTEDGLMIMAKGLGLEEIILNVLKLYCESAHLVLAIGATPKEEQFFIDRLKRENVNCLPKVITSECGADERNGVYLKGGVLFVTSRILVVDMLKKVLPTALVTAVVICRAHKVLDSSQEAFILRLYRQDNKEGTIKAFSDYPEAFSRGFCQVERVMKNLFLKKLYLWPRFHNTVNKCLELHKPQVFEIRLQLTSHMLEIQTALLDLIAVCVKDLKKWNPTLDLEEVTSEKGVGEVFDKIIKYQLEPVWHLLSNKTKQLINDLRELRSILINLTQYDCVTFFNLLDSLKTYEKVLQNTGWIFLPAAESMFVNAQKRVFGAKKVTDQDIPKGAAAIEENPKWLALNEIVREIFDEIEKDGLPPEGNHILIAANDNQTCEQIKEVLLEGTGSLLCRLYDKYRKSKKGSTTETTAKTKPKQSSRATSKDRKEESGILTLTQIMSNNNVGSEDEGSSHSQALIAENPLVVIESLRNSEHATGVGHILTEIRPRFIIMYDASLSFVRQLEVYRASNPSMKIVVYWLVYETSSEEQHYLATIAREKLAFETLIRQKGDMVIPEGRDGQAVGDEDGNSALARGTRKANETVNAAMGGGNTRRGGAAVVREEGATRPQIIVDMREFRSELPSFIHRRGIDIVPVTLEVGDYILTPDICVERKSVSDLIESLNSGRLYSQATAMCRFYKRPMLLIEFDADKPFGFQGKYVPKDQSSSNDFSSKLLLLTIHFPTLRILWCASPYATAEIFEELKNGRDQPSADAAMKITEAMDPQKESQQNLEKYNPAPRNFIMLLPGVDSKNCGSLMNHAGSLHELAKDWSQEKLYKLLENAGVARNIWESIHLPLKSVAPGKMAAKGRYAKWPKKN